MVRYPQVWITLNSTIQLFFIIIAIRCEEGKEFFLNWLKMVTPSDRLILRMLKLTTIPKMLTNTKFEVAYGINNNMMLITLLIKIKYF
jgi:hypothetical protein